MWFKPKIPVYVFVRHCHFSNISAHKNRFSHFSKEKCHENLMHTGQGAQFTFFLDTFYPSEKSHFITKMPYIELKEGTETGSFLKMLGYVSSLNLSDEMLLYFVEDDYMHKEGWIDVLQEGFTIPNIDYVTLYDHRDKYMCYENLTAELFLTQSCHWRTTPSTTNTYAMKFKTLKKHLDIHREFSLNRKITADHDKFCALRQTGSRLISCIPGWSTHAEPEFASPHTNWNSYFTKNQSIVIL